MSEYDEELARWADDDLVRALRAPGTTTELASEEQYVAAFREARGPAPKVRSLPRRTVGRLGAGGTAVVVTVALTSGMAAAYTGHLPDPVQQIAHRVIGAPPPDPTGRTVAGPTRPGQVLAPLPSGSATTTGPSGGTTSSAPTSTPTTSSARPTDGPSGGLTLPSPIPSGDPSATSTPTATVGTPGGMTAAGVTHRAGVGEAVTLTTVLTTAEGSALPDYPVVLQARGPDQWQPVAETITDATGTATVVTPPLAQSERFRWHTDDRVNSAPWLVRMVPTLSVTADVGGTTTVVSGTTQGGRPGDSVQLLRWADHQATMVGTGTLDANGSVSFPVATPPRRGVFALRLLPTHEHAAARAQVRVVPPPVAAVAITAPSHRVPVGGSLTVSGAVRAADGSALSGRPVRLQVRGPKRWFGVGSATTDGSGAVALATPAASRTVRYRLVAANGVHSAPWRVVLVPTLSARPDGADDVVATAVGGQGGDRVVLLRRLGGHLVQVGGTTLGGDGTATLPVVRRARSTTYVVRLVATGRHAAASAKVTVPGSG